MYLAAIRYYHLEKGLEDPLAGRQRLAYLCKGIKRLQGTGHWRRLPLTATLLADLLRQISHGTSLHRSDKAALWAAITLGFHAFLRGSEFTTNTSTTFDPHRHLFRRDITMARDHLTIRIKASKTDPYRASCSLPVAATGKPSCPVKAVRAFLRRSQHSRALPLFTLHSGKFLPRDRLTRWIRQLLRRAGLSPEQVAQYSSHNLRIGAATEAAAAGLPSWLIQAAGRWKSAAYLRYIRSPKQALLRVAPALARQAKPS